MYNQSLWLFYPLAWLL